jgi:hypothetical protein
VWLCIGQPGQLSCQQGPALSVGCAEPLATPPAATDACHPQGHDCPAAHQHSPRWQGPAGDCHQPARQRGARGLPPSRVDAADGRVELPEDAVAGAGPQNEN